MSCSTYGMPQAVSSYPQVQQSFYTEPNSDPYANLTTQNVQQSLQLNLNSLMPANWNSVSAQQAMSSAPQDDWSRYTVTRDGVQRYISASGASRFRQIDRSSAGRQFGQPNLLRSTPPCSMTLGPDAVVFNDSSARLALVGGQNMRSWVGCGN
jgi:hypothetical protein